ncbi:LysR substrate-binding domain-containing protein [Pokkaliibacter sp. CJK22405]|uniref:LysR substrate-binding domain-containing protein n=1 Tax=Pokkaliibacter sp. CJK22405 TaxID=3384615 RepID=UPI0039852A3E
MRKRLMPSLTALQCFESAARHLSFTRAAEELHLTQSAVSKQVAQLEDMLSQPLFARVRRRLHLTPAGALYLTEVDKILNQVDISSRYILTYGGDAEVLRIATQPTFGARWLIPRLPEFTRLHPNIQLDIRNELEPFDLQQSRTDIAFFFGQGQLPGARCRALFSEEVVPVCTPSLLKNQPITDARMLGQCTLIQCTSRPEAWHTWFSRLELTPSNSYHGPRFDTFYMCIRAAQAGYGIALIPRYLVEEELGEGKLMIAFNAPMPSHGLHYIAHAEQQGDVPKIRAFVEWITSSLHSLEE